MLISSWRWFCEWDPVGRLLAAAIHFLSFLLYYCNLPACLLACCYCCCFVLISWMSALWTLPNCRRAPAFAFLSPPPNCSLLLCSEDQLIPLLPSSSFFFPRCTFRFLTVGLYFLQLASLSSLVIC
jgi:hypothetical protein